LAEALAAKLEWTYRVPPPEEQAPHEMPLNYLLLPLILLFIFLSVVQAIFKVNTFGSRYRSSSSGWFDGGWGSGGGFSGGGGFGGGGGFSGGGGSSGGGGASGSW
jgi:uncharacterized protein